jgi:hypothetical protein
MGLGQRRGFGAVQFVFGDEQLVFARTDAGQPVEKSVNRNAERLGELIKPARRNAVFGRFIFLDLLGAACRGGKVLDLDAKHYPIGGRGYLGMASGTRLR